MKVSYVKLWYVIVHPSRLFHQAANCTTVLNEALNLNFRTFYQFLLLCFQQFHHQNFCFSMFCYVLKAQERVVHCESKASAV
jgi:hypothetical protein